MKLVALSAFLIAISSAIAAEDYFDTEQYFIRGNVKCPEFVELWKDNSDQADQYVYWFDGFLSGHSYSNTMTQHYLSNDKLTRPKMLGQDVKTICLLAVVFSYCKGTDRYISQGIHRLMMDLKDPSYFIITQRLSASFDQPHSGQTSTKMLPKVPIRRGE